MGVGLYVLPEGEVPVNISPREEWILARDIKHTIGGDYRNPVARAIARDIERVARWKVANGLA